MRFLAGSGSAYYDCILILITDFILLTALQYKCMLINDYLPAGSYQLDEPQPEVRRFPLPHPLLQHRRPSEGGSAAIQPASVAKTRAAFTVLSRDFFNFRSPVLGTIFLCDDVQE